MPPTGSKVVTNGSPLTYRWLAGILLFVLFATVGSVWGLQARSVRQNYNGVAENKAEVAVMRAQMAHIRESLDEVKHDVKLLVQHQGLDSQRRP